MVDEIYRKSMLRYKRFSEILLNVAIVSIVSEYLLCFLYIIFKMYSMTSLFTIIIVPLIGIIAVDKSKEFEKESNRYKTLLETRKVL